MCALFCCSTTSRIQAAETASAAGRPSFEQLLEGKTTILGINGHPFSQAVYRDVGVSTQIDLLLALGARLYRFDLPHDVSKIPACKAFILQLREKGIEPLPILIPPKRRDLETGPAGIEEEAYRYAFQIGRDLGPDIRYWDLDNEPDDWSLLRLGDSLPSGLPYLYKTPAGTKESDYQTARFDFTIALLRGLARGIREADPEGKLLLNTAGWKHYGYVERVVREKIPFDILAWHWYGEMGNIHDVDSGNLFAKLVSYGRPVWISEGNDRGRGMDDARQARYLTGMLAQLDSRTPRIPVYTIYELLEQPYQNEKLQHFGLVSVAKENGHWKVAEPKQAFREIAGRTGTPPTPHE